jgi:hypothetical protein
MGSSYEVTAITVRFLPGGRGTGSYEEDLGDEMGGVETDDIPF